MLDLCIIGLGISGISVSRWAKKSNLKFLALEKNNEIGGGWFSKSYPNAKLQTHKNTYCYSDKKYDENTSEYPTRIEILKYLKDYSEENKLFENFSFNTEVLDTKCENKIWYIKVKKKDKIYILESKYLCICSGFYTDKKIPDFKNMNNYKGEIKHVQEWSKIGKEDENTFKNKNILVIGNGPSGIDIACLACKKTNKNVTLIYRSPRWIYKRAALFQKNTISNSILDFSILMNRINKKLLIFFVAVYNIIYYFKMYLQGYKLIWWEMPKKPINRSNISLNEEIFELITINKLNYLKGTIEKFNENSVEVKIDNKLKTYKPDLIILATGYNNNIKFRKQNKIPKLYKRILDLEYDNCGYIGFVTTVNWAQTSDLQARWFISYINKKIKKPTKKEINNYLKYEEYFYKIHDNIDYNDYGYRSYSYCKDLANDLGIKGKTSKFNFKYWLKNLDNDEWAY